MRTLKITGKYIIEKLSDPDLLVMLIKKKNSKLLVKEDTAQDILNEVKL